MLAYREGCGSRTPEAERGTEDYFGTTAERLYFNPSRLRRDYGRETKGQYLGSEDGSSYTSERHDGRSEPCPAYGTCLPVSPSTLLSHARPGCYWPLPK